MILFGLNKTKGSQGNKLWTEMIQDGDGSSSMNRIVLFHLIGLFRHGRRAKHMQEIMTTTNGNAHLLDKKR